MRPDTESRERIDRIEAVRLALRVLLQTTGLRVALVTRITGDTWTAEAVLDEAGLGIRPGDQLELASTY